MVWYMWLILMLLVFIFFKQWKKRIMFWLIILFGVIVGWQFFVVTIIMFGVAFLIIGLIESFLDDILG